MPLENAGTAEEHLPSHSRPLRRGASSGLGARAWREGRSTRAEGHGAGLVSAWGLPSGGCPPLGSTDALGSGQAAAGGHRTADEPRVCRAVAGCRCQPGGADNSGLPTLSNRHQRHWKPDLGIPLTRLAKCDGCSLGDRPGPRAPCAPRLSRGVSFTDAARVHQSPQSGSFRSVSRSGPTAPPRLL